MSDGRPYQINCFRNALASPRCWGLCTNCAPLARSGIPSVSFRDLTHAGQQKKQPDVMHEVTVAFHASSLVSLGMLRTSWVLLGSRLALDKPQLIPSADAGQPLALFALGQLDSAVPQRGNPVHYFLTIPHPPSMTPKTALAVFRATVSPSATLDSGAAA